MITKKPWDKLQLYHSQTRRHVLNVFSHTRSKFPLFLATLSHIPVPALWKDKKWTAAPWPHVYPWRHCNVKMTSPHRISAYSGFSGSLFHVFIFHFTMRYLVVSKKKNPLLVWGWDRKILPSWSPFGITCPASWCQTVILGTDFSIPTSHSWWILIFYLGKSIRIERV